MNYCVLKTPTRGYAVFSNVRYELNEIIGQYTTNQKTEFREIIPNLWETHFCRYCNHSNEANTKIIKKGQEWFVISGAEINVGDEITINYKEFEILLGVQPNTFYKNWFNEVNTTNYGINSDNSFPLMVHETKTKNLI